MNPVKEFADFEGKTYAPSTRRAYWSAVKKALSIAGKPLDECESYEEPPGAISGEFRPQKVPESATIGSIFKLFGVKSAEKARRNYQLRAHPELGT